MSNQIPYIDHYWKNVYTNNVSSLGAYKFAGISLADKFKKGDWILDIGCANNEFKSKSNTLIGIDPFNKNADINVKFEDYQPDRIFDIILCLGVFDVASDELIDFVIEKMSSCIKPGGKVYWRNHPQNTGILEIDQAADAAYIKWVSNSIVSKQELKLYPWNFQKHHELADRFGYKITQLEYDFCTFTKQYKIFAEWTRD